MTSAGDGGTRPLPTVGGPGPAAAHDHSARRSPQDEQPTTVIGRVPPRGDADPAPRSAEPQRGAPSQTGRGLRSIELLSGLLGGGILVAGLVLLVLQFAAPGLATDGRGPGGTAVAVHLGVGIVAEVLRAIRGRLRAPIRWAVALLVIAAAVGVLLFVWW